ncbi:50S ribosomal protein L4 [Geomonas sp. Red69]|uniref:Large ribosomal subunit protein uL4 n=1 Tax=Geomonas diazotrophica TaxID=2843197 RepID=A0ABX8JJ49_9BACT|nr:MULTISPECIES: 50S ribosomal protein L4 [Geomonas]MBU5638343.1 50S ribosomal protein L4 [Geomonas diazotrophica]QWV96654.1 50S ribosomal protein L4 [Geomonas nitrogeniifigens]QXE85757.1 50S ribosomal protein L4 [Geomonas nitrogeniifigens]
MAKLDVFDIKKAKVGEIEVSDAVFNDDVREYLIHEAVKIQLANRRQGTVAVKNRAAVSGSGKKPFKQKGTGQARQGCSRAPQYPGGGVAFGPQPKTYNLSMNKKARKAALRSALSMLYKKEAITVLNNFELPAVKTKAFVEVLNAFNLDKTLVITDTANLTLELSARNVKNVKVLGPEGLNIFDIMKYQSVVFTEAAVRRVEGALQS